MSLKPVVDAFERAPAVQDLAARLPARHQSLGLGGLPGSSAAALVAWTARTFPTQGEAETWLGEFYPELLRAGIRAVSLYEANRLVYGPMGLEPD